MYATGASASSRMPDSSSSSILHSSGVPSRRPIVTKAPFLELPGVFPYPAKNAAAAAITAMTARTDTRTGTVRFRDAIIFTGSAILPMQDLQIAASL